MLDSPIGDCQSSDEDNRPESCLSGGRDTGFFEVMKSLAISIVSVDKGGIITHIFGCNPAMIGLGKVTLGRSFFSTPDMPQRILEAFSEALMGHEVSLVFEDNAGQPFRLELRQRTTENGDANGVVGVISQIKKSEKKDTARLDKINTSSVEQEAIAGRLVRSITHDIRNLLVTVYSPLFLARESKDPDERNEFLRMCEHGIEEAIKLVQQLSDLVLQTPSKLCVMNIADVFKGAVASLLRSHVTSKKILFESVFDENLRPVVANATAIERILTNLVINAIEATPGGGRIRIRASNRYTEEAPEGKQGRSGNYVCIEVSDNGTGIPKELLPRIFECGFSLKKNQAGRGVGLSGVADLVEKLNGYVTVESDEKKGTTFCVYIPVAEETAENE